MTFQELLQRYEWVPIPGCPGRYTAPTGLQSIPFEVLVGAKPIRTVNRHCRDILLYASIEGGGVISYEKADGTILHTLCNIEGFHRKLGVLEENKLG